MLSFTVFYYTALQSIVSFWPEGDLHEDVDFIFIFISKQLLKPGLLTQSTCGIFSTGERFIRKFIKNQTPSYTFDSICASCLLRTHKMFFPQGGPSDVC